MTLLLAGSRKNQQHTTNWFRLSSSTGSLWGRIEKKKLLQLVHSTLILSYIQWGLFLCPQVITGTPFPVSRAAPLGEIRALGVLCQTGNYIQRFHCVTGWANVDPCTRGWSTLNLGIMNRSLLLSSLITVRWRSAKVENGFLRVCWIKMAWSTNLKNKASAD